MSSSTQAGPPPDERTREQFLMDTAAERHRATVSRLLKIPEVAAAIRKTFPGQRILVPPPEES